MSKTEYNIIDDVRNYARNAHSLKDGGIARVEMDIDNIVEINKYIEGLESALDRALDAPLEKYLDVNDMAYVNMVKEDFQ